MKSLNHNWEEFYKNNKVSNLPSNFCLFFLAKRIRGESIIDIGCGNGRDTLYIEKMGGYKKIIGIDMAINKDSISEQNIDFIKDDFNNRYDLIRKSDIVYSRFFIHSISNKEIIELIKNTNGYFCAEARAKGDKPGIYKDHNRNFIDEEWIKNKLVELGFNILYEEVGRGMAIYKNENPLIIRIIAKKNIKI